MRYDENDYTALRKSAYLPARETHHGVYLAIYRRFPEPCGHLGLQPSPKHILGGPVKDCRFDAVDIVR